LPDIELLCDWGAVSLGSKVANREWLLSTFQTSHNEISCLGQLFALHHSAHQN
jgi:hypothetical protein